MSPTDLDRFKAACNYPGALDEKAVERGLSAFLRTVGARRRIVRLQAGWRVKDDAPPGQDDIGQIMAGCIKRSHPVRAVNVRGAALAFIGAVIPFACFPSSAPTSVLAFIVMLTALFASASGAVAAFAAICLAGIGAAGLMTAAKHGASTCLTVTAAVDAAFLLERCHAALRMILAPVPIRRAARRLCATLDGDVDSAFDILGDRAGGDVRAALDSRQASDAGAADGVLTMLDRRRSAMSAAVWWSSAVGTAMVCLLVSKLLGLVAPEGGFFSYFSFAVVAILFFTLPFVFGFAGEAVRHAVVSAAAVRARPWAGFAAAPERAPATTLRGSTWDLSWTACALFGAVERRKPAVEAWLRPLFEAFAAGCWLIHWDDDALYWAAKPVVRREPGTQRLHHDARAAFDSDVVKLYFWHGVIVPGFVIARPDEITVAGIFNEINTEVRRVMIERYRHGAEIHGAAAFIRDAGGQRVDHDERYGTLWRRDIPARVIRDGEHEHHVPADEPIMMIEVVNRTPESDGRFRHYWLRVPPTMQTAREAVAWTFNMTAEQYAPEKET